MAVKYDKEINPHAIKATEGIRYTLLREWQRLDAEWRAAKDAKDDRYYDMRRDAEAARLRYVEAETVADIVKKYNMET